MHPPLFIYHVIVRGVGKQILFEDDADRLFFLQTLAKQRVKREAELYAWCLMSNHVHMAVHAPLEQISSLMHSSLLVVDPSTSL